MAAVLPSEGYSGRPLPEKLGLKDGQVVAFIGLPDDLAGLASVRDFGEVVRVTDIPALGGTAHRFDAIHAFVGWADGLEAGLPRLQAALKRDGFLWVSWPKKAAKVPTDVTEDVIRRLALALDLVDVKVAAVSAVWSGLKLVIRKERR